MKWTSLPGWSSKRLTPYNNTADSFMKNLNLFIISEMKVMICLYTNGEAERDYTLWVN